MRMNEDKKATLFDSLSKEEKAVSIPYYVHEWEMYRMERINKRLFAAFLVVLVMLFASNLAWVIYEMSYDTYYYAQEATAEGNGDAAALLSTGEGSVTFNGKSEASGEVSGEENQLQESDEGVPDM